jgi:8-oxo-dGTP pyrophosphatase MutT (NUDIX family)
MKNPTHAGIMVKMTGTDLYLICHATQKYNRNIFVGESWSISKGKIEEGETPIQAAIRELEEETNIHKCEWMVIDENDYSEFKIGSKLVRVFKLNLTPTAFGYRLFCRSNIDEGDLKGLPEMDGYMWVKRETARQLVFKSQKCLFE